MEKKKITLRKLINPSIKVGDKVRMIDGSAFSYSGKQQESLSIIKSYPELTGSNVIIKDIDATVLAVNINNVATLSHNSSAYITDIKLSIGIGEFFTCSKFVEKVEEESKLTPDPFTLPKNWHVVVTEENQKEVSEWMGFKVKTNIIAGMVMDGESVSKNWNPLRLVKTNDYDFGTEITTEQFRKYVLKKEEEKKFPRVMRVKDTPEEKWSEKEVHGYISTLQHSWIGEGDRWRYAEEIPKPIYLTAQEVYEGKGVGIDPKLIKFKE